jgi:hypothetical protein
LVPEMAGSERRVTGVVLWTEMHIMFLQGIVGRCAGGRRPLLVSPRVGRCGFDVGRVVESGECAFVRLLLLFLVEYYYWSVYKDGVDGRERRVGR